MNFVLIFCLSHSAANLFKCVKITVSPMFSFRFSKKLLFLALALAFFSACRSGQNDNGETGAAKPSIVEELKSEIPFSTKEPENFQAEIVVSSNGIERKTFVARNGARRRYDFNADAKNQISTVATDRNYLISPDKKIYAEAASDENVAAPEGWTDFLTNQRLDAKPETIFERLEIEANLTKYRVKLNSAAESEILIFVDEARGFPVRQEFYSIGGGQRTLNFAVELRNLKIPADENSFVVPQNYRKVSPEEFRKILRDIRD